MMWISFDGAAQVRDRFHPSFTRVESFLAELKVVEYVGVLPRSKLVSCGKEKEHGSRAERYLMTHNKRILNAGGVRKQHNAGWIMSAVDLSYMRCGRVMISV